MSYRDEENAFSLTSNLIKFLIASYLGFGILSGFFHSLLGEKLNLSFHAIFSLSNSFFSKGWIWQALTFIFIPEVEGSLNFYFLFSLCFDAYLLWLIGGRVYDELGALKFLKIFFIPSILGSLSALIIMKSLGIYQPILGLSFGLIPLIVSYFFLNPLAQFSFFLPHPVRLRWVGFALISLYLLQDLANLNLPSLIAHLLTLLFAHLYLVIILRKKSPFSFTHKVDQWLMSCFKRKQSTKVIELYDSYSSIEKWIQRALEKVHNKEKLLLRDRVVLWCYKCLKQTKKN